MPDLQSELLDLERRFWTGGADFYQDHLAADCLMLFPGAGMLERPAIIESLAGAARWQDVEITNVRVKQAGRDAAIVAYSARARRQDMESPDSALASSVYVRENGTWKLAFHQQSPNPG